ALRCAAVLLLLAPRSLAGHDRAACLHHRKGELDRSLRVLEAWQSLAPDDPLPLVRQAMLEQQGGSWPGCEAARGRALELARGPARASVAFLGARLALIGIDATNGAATQALDRAEHYLVQCLQEQTNHPDALWVLAAVRAARGDEVGLAALAGAMSQGKSDDPRFHLMSAVCHLVAGDLERALQAGQLA